MKNKFISKLLSLILVTFILSISLVSCNNNNKIREETTLTTKESTETIEWEAPPLAMVNDTIYIMYSCEEKEMDLPPTGTIDIVNLGEYPTENNEANFGEEGMKYWLINEKELWISDKDAIIYFEPESERQ